MIVLDPAGTATCCPPLSARPLSEEQAEQVAVCDLNDAFDLSQPTISHHLKVLHEAGLLAREKRGVWVYYRARTEALASLGALIGSPVASGLG
jgi:ArsR family transcriptional regulator, arsenate/arsenite/antimonite-responsive transcriptional repressor